MKKILGIALLIALVFLTGCCRTVKATVVENNHGLITVETQSGERWAFYGDEEMPGMTGTITLDGDIMTAADFWN